MVFTMTSSPLAWQKFDADKPDPDVEQYIRTLQNNILRQAGVNAADTKEVEKNACNQIAFYESNNNPDLNKAYMVNTFRPSEFDSITTNDASLSDLHRFLLYTQFDWNGGSKMIQRALNNKFHKAGSVRVAGGREYVELDNLIIVKDRTVAIEIETSINLDNGYFTLRQAIRNKTADYGVMIVPWTAEGLGRADEGKALGRLDREFYGATDLRDGPIYRIAILRGIDLYRLMALLHK